MNISTIRPVRMALVAAWVATATVVLVAAGGNKSGSGKPRIAVIPKGTTHEHWKSVEAGAKQAGEEDGVEIVWKVQLREGKGKVVMIRYQEGSASTIEREAGFMEAMAANPGIEVISSNQYAGATVDTAKTKSESMLDTLRQADGIYTPNESSTQGTLLTL